MNETLCIKIVKYNKGQRDYDHNRQTQNISIPTHPVGHRQLGHSKIFEIGVLNLNEVICSAPDLRKKKEASHDECDATTQ